jgi:serine/threonine protein kinase
MPELKLQQSRLDGRYDIIECLGRGSYAEIYVAHDNAAQSGAPATVVIKALNVFLGEAPDVELEHTLIANFQNEAVALDRVRHPNIISRLGHGTAIDLDGTTFHYIVLEYLSGGDMAALSRNHALPIEKAMFYLEQVCSGLAHAHQCGVIHRDIKPQNLLLSGDREVVKIADFGVARLESHEGAITRVGTNIYSAPEHNPLVQTGALDLGLIAAGQSHLKPAADIYSLAKTTYALIAGESPRKFAQHAITEMPASVSSHYWAAPVLRVLQKATQTRLEARYQTVQEFWDDLAEATLPQTLPLPGHTDIKRKPSFDLAVAADEFPKAPPQPRFELVYRPSPGTSEETGRKASDQENVPGSPEYAAAPRADIPRYAQRHTEGPPAKRPKIVVPVELAQAAAGKPGTVPVQQSAKDRIAAMPPVGRVGKPSAYPRAPVGPRRARPYLVAAILILAFAGMLLATHKYVTSRWNPFVDLPLMGDLFIIGREGVTTTDVRLRPDGSTNNPPVGLAESGSRVKILSTNENWYEVQVLQHGRAKIDPFTSDRGWVNKRFVKFD